MNRKTGQKKVLIWFNVALICISFSWAFGGAVKDMYNFTRYFWFTYNCEVNGRAEEEKQSMWELVDLPGLIRYGMNALSLTDLKCHY